MSAAESSVLSTQDEEAVRDASDGELQLKFDALGVIVLANDGTMFRIRNWNEMIESERRTTVRLIAKRNAKRKEELLRRKESGEEPLAEGTEADVDSSLAGTLLQIANVAAGDGEEA